MDTPTIIQYYNEMDPAKRLALLNLSIESGEEPELNAIRKDLWEIRYKDKAQSGGDTRADGFLALWMKMEFNKNHGNKFLGKKGGRKEILKQLDKLTFKEFAAKGRDYEELLYRECCHMVKIYMELCESDRSYGTTLCGIIKISNDKLKDKLKDDIYTTAVEFPREFDLEDELGIVTRAAREMYELHFPGEGSLRA